MEYPVIYAGAAAGTVQVVPERDGLRFTADLSVHPNSVLRLYGCAPDGRALRVGVPQPTGAGLALTRFLSGQTLRAEGFAPDNPPEQYILADAAPHPSEPEKPPMRTGDPLVDAGLAAGTLTVSRADGGVTVSCPFIPGAVCPLAFALTACTISDGQAILRLLSS
ncbi:MAG: hypothetical protein SPJ01_04220 [Butyricicoccus sp.]|nr:hypothetical protein [Butyricicoccus sp.]